MSDDDTRYFSRLRLKTHTADLAALGRMMSANLYREHKLIWKAFDIDPEAKRDFLYRREEAQGDLVYYVVSARAPQPDPDLWAWDIKEYAPALANGDRLTFSLRANPVSRRREERSAADSAAYLAGRKERGARPTDDTRRVKRDDVVMAAKRRLIQELGERWFEQVPRVELENAAGRAWLESRGEAGGFAVEEMAVTAYERQEFVGSGGHCAVVGRMDMEGILRVTDADKFRALLIGGLGPAKAFGCGLLLVRCLG